MSPDVDRLDGSCHCGAVRFRVTLPDGLRKPRRCNCSLCRMRGAVVVSAEVGGIEITSGADKLTLYRFNTMTAHHRFCSVCGIYTHHRRRSNPNQYGVNVACLDDVSPFDFPAVPVFEGARHPSDSPGRGSEVAGMLAYRPSGKPERRLGARSSPLTSQDVERLGEASTGGAGRSRTIGFRPSPGSKSRFRRSTLKRHGQARRRSPGTAAEADLAGLLTLHHRAFGREPEPAPGHPAGDRGRVGCRRPGARRIKSPLSYAAVLVGRPQLP